MARGARALSLETSPRARVRTPVTNVTADMIKLAQDAFKANKVANAATATFNAKKKALFKAMAAADVTSFRTVGETATGGTVPVLAVIESAVVDEISVAKLRNLVDDATFMSIIKAAKGEVEKAAGEHIAIKALETITKPASLAVREIKP